MPTWPTTGSFPQCPSPGTWQRQRQSNLLSFEPDVGPPLTRKRSTVSTLSVSFSIVLYTAQLATLDTFFTVDAAEGAIPFDWKNPETGVVEAWSFVEPPAVQKPFKDRYEVQIRLRRDF